MALDAHKGFFRDCEEQGLLRFHKDDLRRLFYACLAVDAVRGLDEYMLATTNDTLTALREHPATRQRRIAADQYAIMMEGQEAADLLAGMELSAPWSGAREGGRALDPRQDRHGGVPLFPPFVKNIVRSVGFSYQRWVCLSYLTIQRAYRMNTGEREQVISHERY